MERFSSDSIIKKNDCLVCDNYCRISLLNIPGKVLANVLLGRLRPVIVPSLLMTNAVFNLKGEQLNRFRYCTPQRGTIEQI